MESVATVPVTSHVGNPSSSYSGSSDGVIPVIDVSKIALSNVDVSDKCYDAVGKEFCQALSTCGFAYLKNHGIPWRMVEACTEEAKIFFEKDAKTKIKYSRGTLRIDGYSAVGREVLQDDQLVECKESFDISSTTTVFPRECRQMAWKKAAQGLALQSIMLGKRLLKCMALDLGADPVKFLSYHDQIFRNNQNNATALRILRYPAVTDLHRRVAGAAITRCGEHTDYGGLTLLYQDSCGGLEIEDIDGNWISATPIPETIVVNIGDLMSFWSGGRYKATKHRVKLTDQRAAAVDRYSVAMFMHPNQQTELVPFTQGQSSANQAVPDIEDRPRHLTAGEHVQKRFAATYYKR